LVRGNQLRLEQAATNILRNALDAIADGILEIRVEAGDVAQIVVRDDGPGLGDVPLEDLTEPFYTTRASGEGMGLGLAISVEIVREHGGQITARNRDEGGAEFTINLPLAEDIT
jgi:two-component system C4-dicarboxylate transport sensor histidine kinase DctB